MGPTPTTRYLEPDGVRAAAGLVRLGQVISLNRPLTDRLGGRQALKRTVFADHRLWDLGDGRLAVINDDAVEIALQGSSHWDAIAHFGVVEPQSVYFGGAGIDETSQGHARSLGIDLLAGGVATRGVLLDMVGLLAAPGAEWLAPDTRIRRAEVVRCLEAQNVSLRRGDAVLVHTGYHQRVAAEPDASTAAVAGVDADTLELWEASETFALLADNRAVEPSPSQDLPLHVGALTKLGLFLGEGWNLGELAAACAADGVYEFMFVSVPLNIPGAYGSPSNAVAIR